MRLSDTDSSERCIKEVGFTPQGDTSIWKCRLETHANPPVLALYNDLLPDIAVKHPGPRLIEIACFCMWHPKSNWRSLSPDSQLIRLHGLR